MDEIIAFLLQLPTELEVVKQSVRFPNDLNLLEYWYRRLEYAVNVLKVVVERVELFQQDFAGISTVVLILREASLLIVKSWNFKVHNTLFTKK